MAEDVSRKKYSCLDQLSTKELEQILRGAALAGDDDDPAELDQILEVIMARKEHTIHFEAPDVEQARRDFDNLYRGLEEPLYPVDDASPHISPSSSFKSRPSKRSLRYILVAAVVATALIAATCIPVLGYANVVQLVAHWTETQFNFQVDSPASASEVQTRESGRPQLPEEYAELQDALELQGLPLSVPIFPEEFEAGEPLLYTNSVTGDIEFSIMYKRGTDYISFDLIQNGEAPFLTYEKDKKDVEEFEYNGIMYYIMSNNDTVTTVWRKENLEYHISTGLSCSDIKALIQTIY